MKECKKCGREMTVIPLDEQMTSGINCPKMHVNVVIGCVPCNIRHANVIRGQWYYYPENEILFTLPYEKLKL